jgi:tellurite resistance protein TerC
VRRRNPMKSLEYGVHPERNPILLLVRRTLPMTVDFQGERFFVRRGEFYATPLLAVIVMVMTTDVVSAVDSVPAIFAITSSTFIVWTANAFAVLGLRPLYFMLAGMIERFVYLSLGLSIVLVFVGVKFMVSDLVGKVPIWISLPFIATVVAASIGLRCGRPAASTHEPRQARSARWGLCRRAPYTFIHPTS